MTRRTPALWASLALLPGLLLRWRSWRLTPPIVNERVSTYLQQAQELVRSQSLTGPEALRRPPTYPAFLALHLAAFGPGWAPVVFSQHVLGLAAAVLWMIVARRVWKSPAAALAAGFLAAADPFLLFYEAHVESESLFLFLLAATLCLLVLALDAEERRLWLLPLAGLAAGAAALCRPEFALFPVAAAPVLAWPPDGWKDALLLAAPACLMVLAWMAHNFLVFGVFTLSLMGGITSLQTSGPFIDWSAPTHAVAKAAYREALDRNGGSHLAASNDAVVILMDERGLKFAQAAREMAGLGRETFLRHPASYLWATRRNFLDYFHGLGGGDAPILALWPHRLAARAYWGLLVLGGALGLGLALRRHRSRGAALLLLTSAYLVLANCLVEIGSVDRRSLELQPLLLLFASLPLAAALSPLFKERARK